MNEIWKDVDGYIGYYQVSNFGNVRSVTHKTRAGHLYTGRAIKKQTDLDGYSIVTFSKHNIRKTKRVCQLVANCFIGKTNEKDTVNHIDKNKKNDFVGNLEFLSRLENSRYSAKLSIGDIEKIRIMRFIGFKQQEIADNFGVRQSAISKILNHKRWA